MALEITNEEINKLIDDGAILLEDSYKPDAIVDSNATEKLKAKIVSGIICDNPYERIKEVLSKIDISDTDTLYIAKKEKGKEYKDWDILHYYNSIMIEYSRVRRPMLDPQKIIVLSNFSSIKELKNAIESFYDSNIKPDKIVVNLENRDYDDIDILKELEGKYKLEVRYGTELSYKLDNTDDFISMRTTINYYKNLILDSNLSPLEQLVYAYDLIKSFEYNESEKPDESRRIDKIIKTNHIVCVGYSLLLEQLLNELGIDTISILSMSPSESQKDQMDWHYRNLIKLNDEKYGIKGFFALDATFDSARNVIKVVDENGNEKIIPSIEKKESDTTEKYYDNLSLYRCFLVPMEDYQSIFKGENMPYEPEFFGDTEILPNPRRKIVRNTNPMFEKILRAIATVRLKQGYSKEAAIESIKGIIEINDYFDKSNSADLQAATIKNNF